jgi:hypothetical protein
LVACGASHLTDPRYYCDGAVCRSSTVGRRSTGRVPSQSASLYIYLYICLYISLRVLIHYYIQSDEHREASTNFFVSLTSTRGVVWTTNCFVSQATTRGRGSLSLRVLIHYKFSRSCCTTSTVYPPTTGPDPLQAQLILLHYFTTLHYLSIYPSIHTPTYQPTY